MCLVCVFLFMRFKFNLPGRVAIDNSYWLYIRELIDLAFGNACTYT